MNIHIHTCDRDYSTCSRGCAWFIGGCSNLLLNLIIITLFCQTISHDSGKKTIAAATNQTSEVYLASLELEAHILVYMLWCGNCSRKERRKCQEISKAERCMYDTKWMNSDFLTFSMDLFMTMPVSISLDFNFLFIV